MNKKITVLGDIMCEPMMLEYGRGETGFDFSFAFEHIKGLLSEADYVIANLETPIAGEEAQFTNTLVSFNAPEAFARAVKEAGVDVVSMANNHALDRGLDGLFTTLDTLEKIGLPTTGAYRDGAAEQRIHYFTLGPTKLALIAYTTSTNYVLNRIKLEEPHERCINYLRPVDAPMMGPVPPQPYVRMIDFIEEIAGRPLQFEEKTRLKRVMGVKIAYSDDFFDSSECTAYLDHLREDFQEAKRMGADLVLFYPHTGGQFNIKSGSFSNYIVDQSVLMGFDAVLAAHSHTSQQAKYVRGVPCFYSLGNVTLSPNSFYAVKESLPEYGLAVHLYIRDKNIVGTTFSIIKIIESSQEKLTVYPVDELYGSMESSEERSALEQDVSAVYTRVTGALLDAPLIRREYSLGPIGEVQ
jgi:poly-gamma-glutamate capsule biosynthesis protein CapA/YwtB (metallophosphatase superfamily)